jgi:hypothetical protein
MSITLPSIADALQNVARLDTAVELRGAGAGHGETMGADEAWRTLKVSFFFMIFEGRPA